MALSDISPRPSPDATLNSNAVFFVGVTGDTVPGGAIAAQAYTRTSADAGTIVFHAADPGNADANNAGNALTIDRDALTISYTPTATLVAGSAPRFNMSVFDITGWVGVSGSMPSNSDGNPNGSATYFGGNYYRKDAGVWVNVGGFPNSEPEFTAYFSSITFNIVAASGQNPTANNQSVTVTENGSTNITLTASDPDGTIATWTTSNPSNGSLSGTGQSRTYTPNASYVGPDSFTFTVTDNDSNVSNTATVSITVIAAGSNVVLTAAPETGVNAVLGTPGTYFLGVTADGVTAGATDASVFTRNQPNQGVLVLHGMDSIAGNPSENGGLVTLNRDDLTATYVAGGTLTNGSTPQYNVTMMDITGWVGESLTTPNNADANPNGSTTVFNQNYYRKDGGSWTFLGGFPTTQPEFTAYFSSITFDVSTVASQDPVAVNQSVAVFQDTPKAITLGATDADGTITSWGISTAPTNGSLTTPNAVVTYTPNGGYVGPDSFTFFVNDNEGNISNTATVTINVVNQETQAPVTQDLDVRVDVGVQKSIFLPGYDGDGTIASWNIDSGNLQGTLTGTAPALLYNSPANGWTGVDSFTYTVTDNDNAVSNKSTVVFRVLPSDACYSGNMVMSKTNVIANSVLASNFASDTSIAWLKNPDDAELTRFTSPFDSAELTITATFGSRQVVNYFAIPGSTLSVGNEVKLDLLINAGSNVSTYTSAWFTITQDMVDNNSVFAEFFGDQVAEESVLTIRHKYPIATDPGSTVVDDGIPRQEANGVLSIEAESGALENPGRQTYQVTAEASASSGQMVELAATSNLNYSTYSIGPKLVFEFTATYNGDCNVWLLLRSTNQTDFALFSNLEGSNFGPSLYSDPSIANSGWVWRNIRAVNLEAGRKCRYIVSPRKPNIQLDKLLIQPTALGTPTGFGQGVSPNGTKVVAADGTDSGDSKIDLRMWMCGEAIRLDKNVAYGTQIKLVTDPEVMKNSAGMASKVSEQYLAREITIDYPAMSQEDRRRLAELERAHAGIDDRMLVSVYAGANREEWMQKQYTMLTMFDTATNYINSFERRHRTGAIRLPEA